MASLFNSMAMSLLMWPMPILTVNSAARRLQRSFPAVNEAIERLAATAILRQVKVGRRNRAFEASEVIAAFTDLERRLANPAGDTLVAPPVWPVPRRPPPE